MPDDQKQTHRRRDAEVLTIIGSFLSILAVLVLIGTIFQGRGEGMVVGIGAGLLLLLIGLGAASLGLRWLRNPDQQG